MNENQSPVRMVNEIANEKGIQLTWFGHSCFGLDYRGIYVLFDPVRMNKLLLTVLEPDNVKKPNGILISHEHWDHCDPKTVLDLCSGSTIVYGPQSIDYPLIHEMSFRSKDMDDLKEASKVITIVNSETDILLNNLKIKCLAAQEGLAYILHMGNRKLLFMGDSPATLEMISENPDIILFPIWAVKGEEAKLDDFLIMAKDALCIPMHYHLSQDAYPNFFVNMEEVKELLMTVNLNILQRGEPIII